MCETSSTVGVVGHIALPNFKSRKPVVGLQWWIQFTTVIQKES